MADSIRIRFVLASISVFLPPMAPARATGISLEVITMSLEFNSTSESSIRVIFSPGLAARTMIFGESVPPIAINLS